MGLVSELKRRNVFRMAVLYVVAAWLIMQVAEVVKDLANLPAWIGPTTLMLLAIGFPIALIVSWFYEVTPEGISLEKDVAPGESITHVTGRRLDFLVIALLCAAVIMFAYDKWWLPEPPEQSVAVLPFANLSNDPEMDFLSDGVTETLLHALAQLPDLKVPARTSAFFFKGQDIDVRKIAGQLGVSNVLEGSVQRDGNKVRIVAQLIEAETGFHLWSNSYDRDMNDIFAVQDDIANSVVLAMQVTLIGDKGRGDGKIQTVGTNNVAAYEKYLKGLQQKNIFSHTSLRLAEISFKEALALDPGFYEAKRELMQTYGWQQGTGVITNVEAYERIMPLLDRLLEERPDDGLALMTLGYYQNPRSAYIPPLPPAAQSDVAFDVEKHLAELTAAIERVPNEPRFYYAMALHLSWENRSEEGLEWLDRGIVVAPFDWVLHAWRGAFLLREGNLDEAEASFTRIVELNPEGPVVYQFLSRIAWQRQQYAQWFAMLKKMMELDPLDYGVSAIVANGLYTVGLMEEGDKYLQRAIALAPDNVGVQAAKLDRLLYLDDRSQARDMSEILLRADIDARYVSYRQVALAFMSTMAELGKSDEALAVLEEVQPGVTSPDFRPQYDKQQTLHYHAILALAQLQSKEDTLSMLDAVVSRWDESFPRWRDNPANVAAIEMARGQTELAIELALEDLDDGMRGAALYRNIGYFKALARQPAVATRLAELDAEAKKAGEEIWAYIVEHQLQL